MYLKKEEVILGVVFFLFFAIAASPHIDGGDVQVYLSGAKGIFEGKGYTDISTPFEKPITIYPPVFSILLSPFFILGENAVFVAKLFVALLAAASLIIAKRLFEQIFDRKFSLLMTAAAGVSLLFYWYATKLLSEIPFLFFSLLSIYFFLLAEKENFGSNKPITKNQGLNFFAFSLLFLLISFYTRTIGITLAAAFAVVLLSKKQYRLFAILAVIISAALFGWYLYTNAEVSGKDSYFDQFLRADLYDYNSPPATISDFAERVGGNSFFYFLNSIPETVFSPLQALVNFFGRQMLMPLSAFLFFVFIFGLVIFTKKNYFNVFSIYAIFYVIFLLFWPYADTSITNRFLLPVMPLLLMFFVFGLKSISETQWLRKISVKGLSFAALILILMCGVSLASDAYFIYTQEQRQFTPSYKDIQDVSSWLKENAAPGSTVYSNEWQRIYLLSGIQGYASPDHLNKPLLQQFFKKNNFTYVVLLNLDKPEEAEYWPEKPILQQMMSGKEVYTSKSGNAVVYKIN